MGCELWGLIISHNPQPTTHNMTTKTIIIKSLDELPKLAKVLLEFIETRKVLCFYGEIGAGKTTFIKTLAAMLGVSDQVSSPTFAIANQYPFENGWIHHLDLYRLKNIQEALDIGIEDYLYSGNYCFVEWPELIEPLLSDDIVKIYIEIVDNANRKFLLCR